MAGVSGERSADRRMYFDANVYGEACDNAEVHRLLSQSLSAGGSSLLVSLINLSELAGHGDPEKRRRLFEVVSGWAGCEPLFDQPSVILRSSLHALVKGEAGYEARVGDTVGRFLEAVASDPAAASKVIEDDRLFKEQTEKAWNEAHLAARGPIQGAIADPSVANTCRTAFAFARHVILDRPEESFVMGAVESVGTHGIRTPGVDEALRIDEWRWFLCSLAVWIFLRTIPAEGYGRRANAGAWDAQQAVYAGIADVVVTRDGGWFKLLRQTAAVVTDLFPDCHVARIIHLDELVRELREAAMPSADSEI